MMGLKKQAKAALASTAAAPKGDPTVKGDKPAWYILAATDIAGMKEGDTMTESRHVVPYIREMAKAKELEFDKYTDPQLFTAAKQVAPMESADDHIEAILTAVQALEIREPTADTAVEREKLRNVSQMYAWAGDLGKSVDATFEGHISKAITGRQDWEGAPILVIGDLERMWGRAKLEAMPLVGSYWEGATMRDGKPRKGALLPLAKGDNTIRHSDYMQITLEDGEVKTKRFYEVLANDTQVSRALFQQRENVKAILENNALPPSTTLPAEWMEHLPPKTPNPDAVWFGALNSQLNTTIKRRQDRLVRGMSLWQMSERIANRFGRGASAHLTWGWAAGSADKAAPQDKPIVMRGMVKEADGVERMQTFPKVYTLATFLRLKPEQVPANASYAVLMATAKGVRKPKNEGTKVAAKVKPLLENTMEFQGALNAAYDYIDGHDTMIRGKLADAENGAEFAYWITWLYGALKPYATDKAIQARAVAWNEAQIKGRGAEEALDAGVTEATTAKVETALAKTA